MFATLLCPQPEVKNSLAVERGEWVEKKKEDW